MNQETARQILLTHGRSKTNGMFPETFNLEAKMTNPVCGDHVEIKILSDGKRILDIGHKASACAICSASASLLCQEMKGVDVMAARESGALFERSVMESSQGEWPRELEAFMCFEHLRVNPARKMCALLPWVVLKSALKGAHGEMKS